MMLNIILRKLPSHHGEVSVISTFVQSCRDRATASCVSTVEVGIKPLTSRSVYRDFTTDYRAPLTGLFDII